MNIAMRLQRVGGQLPVFLFQLDQPLGQAHRVLVEHVVIEYAVADQQVAAEVFDEFDR